MVRHDLRSLGLIHHLASDPPVMSWLQRLPLLQHRTAFKEIVDRLTFGPMSQAHPAFDSDSLSPVLRVWHSAL